jgi:hypothetical protein
MLNEGISLAALIDALLRSLKNQAAVKLITSALSSGDFIVEPDLGSTWHLDCPAKARASHFLRSTRVPEDTCTVRAAGDRALTPRGYRTSRDHP